MENKKMKKFLIMASVVGGVLLVAYVALKIYAFSLVSITPVSEEVEYRSEWRMSDLVTVQNGDLRDSYEKVTFRKLGSYKVSVKVHKWIFTTMKPVEFNVVDTQPPVIEFQHLDDLSVNSYPSEDSFGYDISQFYSVHDNGSFQDVEVEVKGTIKGHTEGYYPITVTATDTVGNASTASATIHISGNGKGSSSSSKRKCKGCGKTSSTGLSGGGYCDDCARKNLWKDSTDVDVWWGY